MDNQTESLYDLEFSNVSLAFFYLDNVSGLWDSGFSIHILGLTIQTCESRSISPKHSIWAPLPVFCPKKKKKKVLGLSLGLGSEIRNRNVRAGRHLMDQLAQIYDLVSEETKASGVTALTNIVY